MVRPAWRRAVEERGGKRRPEGARARRGEGGAAWSCLPLFEAARRRARLERAALRPLHPVRHHSETRCFFRPARAYARLACALGSRSLNTRPASIAMSARPGFVPDREAGSAQVRALRGRVATLEARVAWLEDALTRMLGEPDAAAHAALHARTQAPEGAQAVPAGTQAIPEIVPNPMLDRFLLRTQPMRSPYLLSPAARAFAAAPLHAEAEGGGDQQTGNFEPAQPLVLNLDEPAAPAAPVDLQARLLQQAQRQMEQHLRERAQASGNDAAREAREAPADAACAPAAHAASAAQATSIVRAAPSANAAPPPRTASANAPANTPATAPVATALPAAPSASPRDGFSLGITAAFETLEDKIAMAADAELAVATRKRRPASPGIALLPEMAATGRLAADRKMEVCCALEMLNPSILQQIMAIWHLPECAARVQRLVNEDQGHNSGRTGLDPAVREELILLGQVRVALTASS